MRFVTLFIPILLVVERCLMHAMQDEIIFFPTGHEAIVLTY